MDNKENIIEAIMFALGRKISVEELATTLNVEKTVISDAVDNLKKKYSNEDGGINFVKLGDGYQLVTNNKYYDYVSAFINSNKKGNLSNTCMEVLSIIAYNPKITKTEIENIRGVNSDSQVSRLLEYGLIEEVGRLKVPGRPAIFSVTDEFLRNMGIESITKLPNYDEIKREDVESSKVDVER